MQPEDIDQLFRDRLEGHASTPPDHLWAQLEEELAPAKKRPAMWLYAAAMVALLLAAGLGWLLQAPGTTDTADHLATTTPAVSTPKKDVPTQATAPRHLASTSSEAPVATAPGALAAQPAAPVVRRSVAQAAARMVTTATSTRPAPAAVARLTIPTEARPERLGTVAALEVAAVPATLTTTRVPTRPIEVEVVREAETPVLAAAEAPAPASQHHTRLGAVLRQARNAVTGAPVDLQQVGLPETLTVQARVAGHQLNKTIQL